MRLLALPIAFLLAGPALFLRAQSPQIGGGNIFTVIGDGCTGTDVSGIPAGCFNGDGPGTKAQISFDLLGRVQGDTDEDLAHMAFDSSGNLYFADKGNQIVRKLDTSGKVTTIAGGVNNDGFNGDQSQPGLSAPLSYPSGIFVDASGTIYIADEDSNRIRKIDSKGNISTVIGTGDPNLGGGFNGDGRAALSTQLDGPEAVVVDAAGNIYFADTYNSRVRKMDAQTGLVSTVAGTGGDPVRSTPGKDNVPATTVALGEPSALALDGKGNLFFSDMLNNVIRVVDLQTGLIRRIAGTGAHSDNNPTGDGGPPTQASLGYPAGLVIDPATGDLWFSDMHNNVVRRISSPLTPNAVISTPIGFGTPAGFSGEGQPAFGALLNRPVGLALDSKGNLYVMDYYNQRIRMVTPGSNVPPPVIFQNGVVNGASFTPAPAPVAPGSIISIFGRRLNPARGAASTLPLPTTLLSAPSAASAKVTSGGATTALPLYYVSSDQINAQLPFEVQPGQATVTVQMGTVQSNPVSFTVGATAPGIFVYQGNRAVAQNYPEYSLNTSANPIARGGTVIVYLSGVGALNPAIATGQPAPGSPVSPSVAIPSAVFGGAGASVSFLGAAPGFVGLDQANIIVPTNIQPGDQPLVIHLGTLDSNTALISVK